MELFDEALRKWEQALNIRHQGNSTSSNNSLVLQGAACGDFLTVTIAARKPRFKLLWLFLNLLCF